MKTPWFLITTCVAIALTGCGGGSSGSSSNVASTAFIQDAPMVVTSNMAATATGAVLNGITVADDTGAGSLDLSGGAVGASVEADSQVPLTDRAIALATKASAYVTSELAGAVGVVTEQTAECAISGSETVRIDTGSVSLQDFEAALGAGAVPSGVSVRVSFVSCVESPDDSVNGIFEVTFVQFPLQADIGSTDFVIEIQTVFDGLEADGGRIDGDLALTLTSTGSAGVSVTTTGEFIQVTAAGRTIALIDYSVSVADDGTDLIETTVNFTINDTQLSGGLTVTTLDPLVVSNLNGYLSGSLSISGADGTSITMTVLDGEFAQIEVDTDGDGLSNETIILTLAELGA